MDSVAGLLDYVEMKQFKEALLIPPGERVEYRLLAQGEYNRNYVFTHPVTGKKLVLRVNFGSQMHLEHQIEYEYEALKLLEKCGRTPAPLYVDGSRNTVPYGLMVMEYLPGHALDYETELLGAAGCLADIHSIKIPKEHHLIVPDQPLKAILEECEEMFAVYKNSPLGDQKKKEKISSMLKLGWEKIHHSKETSYRCCINTELNSTNFLVDGEHNHTYLVDWEKPLYGDPAQDLGHFLAPTTTFWKTDIILNKETTDGFIEEYIRKVGRRFDTGDLHDRVYQYIPVNCLRGITWCAMAFIEYQQPGKEIVNESTAVKLEQYLDDDFLEKINGIICI